MHTSIIRGPSEHQAATTSQQTSQEFANWTNTGSKGAQQSPLLAAQSPSQQHQPSTSAEEPRNQQAASSTHFTTKGYL